MDRDTIQAVTGNTTTGIRALPDGTVVRIRYQMPTHHVDICRPGTVPTHQGRIHNFVLSKGWPVQYAYGHGRRPRYSRDHYWPTFDAALEALVKHKSQLTPDRPWDDVAGWTRQLSNDMAVAAGRSGELVSGREVFIALPDGDGDEHRAALAAALGLAGPNLLRGDMRYVPGGGDIEPAFANLPSVGVLRGVVLDRPGQGDLDKAVAYARAHGLRYIETRTTTYDSGA